MIEKYNGSTILFPPICEIVSFMANGNFGD